MSDEKMTIREKLHYNIRGIHLIPQLVHWNMFSNVILALFQVVIAYWSYIFLARLIDDMLAKVSHEVIIQDVIILVGGECVIRVFFTIWLYYYFYCGSILWDRANTYLDSKIMDMDYEYMESETIQNLRRDIDARARYDGGGMNTLFWRVSPMIQRGLHIFVALCYVIYLMTRVFVAFPGNPLLSGLFIVGFSALLGALLMLSLHKNKKAQEEIFNGNDELVSYMREFNFYSEEYIQREENGKNIRMFHQQGLLAYHIDKLGKIVHSIINRVAGYEEKRNEWLGIIEAVISSIIYFLLGVLVLKKAISVGSVCLYAGCITNFLFNFHRWVAQITELSGNTKYIKMYFDFLDIPNKKYEGTLPVEKRDDDKYTLEFRNVSFHYPGSTKDVLKNFSIKFRIGERLAVVGKNGSGKTTFIKLLCRLYDPTEGEILMNGIDIRKFDYKEYLSLFSVVFQDFKIPAFPLGQNVAASMEYNSQKAKRALERMGLEKMMSQMNQGLDTPLYTDFDNEGVDISGGEAQKVAIARALYHDTPFVILDEPTAALDPLAEYEVYSKFDELVGSKTAVYISHRLSSCQFCNDIVVIDNGKAVQRGNHEELVEDKAGLYYTLWHTQAQYYQA